MKQATFDPTGGRIEVGVTCDPNRNGSYTIFLWEGGKNEIVKEFPGNFINTDDDSYQLAKPNSRQDGRLVEALVVVAIPSGVGPSDVTLAISQDGNELATESAIVPPGSPGQMVDLFIMLRAK
jgi:hypothetical protein